MSDRRSARPSPTRRGFLSGMLAAPLLTARTASAGFSQADPPLFRSLTGQFTVEVPRRRIGPLRTLGMDGKSAQLQLDHGRPTLLCFWATWCPPCRRELPMLERLHVEHSGLVNVRPIAIDREGDRSVAPFLNKLGVRRLTSHIDPTGVLAKPVGVVSDAPFTLWGMPLTYLIDGHGFMAGWLVGEADWTSPEGLALLRFFANK